MLKFVWSKQLLFWIIIFCLFLLTNFALAQECTDPEPEEEQYDSWYEYRCAGSNCGQDVLRQLCEETCSRSCECVEDNGSWTWSCSDWICNTSCGSSGIYQDCSDWQVCEGSTSWRGSLKSCECEGSCLDQPTNLSPENGEQKVQLPITLTWDGVSGANSYRYKVGTIENFTTANSVTIDEEGNCLLKSNTDYSWQIQACCGSNGDDCGTWSAANFKTSLAPQPISPENNATDVSVPVNFDWCDVSEAQSYAIFIYKDGEIWYMDGIIKKGGTLLSKNTPELEIFTWETTYEWDLVSCIDTNYKKCGIDCQENQDAFECGDFGQRWNFVTTKGGLSFPTLLHPFYSPDKPVPIVNLQNFLEWSTVLKAVSYRYQIKKGGEIIIDSSTDSIVVPFYDLWNYLYFDTEYSWQVETCWDKEGEDCGIASNEWNFKTTGATPNLLSPVYDSEGVNIPVTLDWGDIEGALSYKYELSTDSAFSDITAKEVAINSNTSVGYPELESLTQYYWRVKSCADGNGELCGDWREGGKFTTSEISPPINPYPEDNGNLLTSERYLKWDKASGANFYQYKVDYGGIEKIPPTIVPTNSAFLLMEGLELGEYTWYVQSCLDEGCQETSGFSGPWHFNLVESDGYEERGLVPCGRNYDNPDTPWNERDPCQFRHIFLLLNNILNFLLWRLGLIILVLLVVATGVIYYFSMGAPSTMVKVKSVLISAAKGYGIVLLAWLIINWILIILRFQIEFFGNWWQINF